MILTFGMVLLRANALEESPMALPEGYVFGRPTLYKPEFCRMLIEHMANGFSLESFGAVAGCSKSALYKWLEEHEDFKNAYGEAKAWHLFSMEKKAAEHMVDQHQGPKLNTALWKFIASNVHGMRSEPQPEQQAEATIKIIVDSEDANL